MNISDFDYDLPKELIAQRPIEPRTHSKLMVLKEGKIVHKKFYEIVSEFKEGDVLVVNETKVMKTKIFCHKETGGKIELMFDNLDSTWATLKGKLKVLDKVIFGKNYFGIVKEKNENRVNFELSSSTKEIIETFGELPVPPYIKEKIKADSEYQTAFSNKEGSLASPTAGLHFDRELLNEIQKQGVLLARVCLHVSYDTFLPVKVEDPREHKMHGEYCEINEENASLINSAKRIFVVGTTTLKALETLSESGKVISGGKVSTLFIYPGYSFNLEYTGLITNFHLPKSTLMMLVSAFLNREGILAAYETAVKEKYRFFSFGDAMLIYRRENSHPQ